MSGIAHKKMGVQFAKETSVKAEKGEARRCGPKQVSGLTDTFRQLMRDRTESFPEGF